MLLDVGSGTTEEGGHKFLRGESIVHVDITKKAFHVEVVCDAQCLPFIDNGFSTVNASHILEHLENPLQALREFKRVAEHLVIIQVPNAPYFERTGESDGHIFSWNRKTLKQLLERVFSDVSVLGYVRKSKRFLKNVKIWTLSSIFGHHTIIAYCWKSDHNGLRVTRDPLSQNLESS